MQRDSANAASKSRRATASRAGLSTCSSSSSVLAASPAAVVNLGRGWAGAFAAWGRAHWGRHPPKWARPCPAICAFGLGEHWAGPVAGAPAAVAILSLIR